MLCTEGRRLRERYQESALVWADCIQQHASVETVERLGREMWSSAYSGRYACSQSSVLTSHSYSIKEDESRKPSARLSPPSRVGILLVMHSKVPSNRIGGGHFANLASYYK